MSPDPDPPLQPPPPDAHGATAAEEAARSAPDAVLTEQEKARLAAEASREEDA